MALFAAFAKGEAPVADAEAVAGRLESVKLLHVAGFCFQEPGQALEQVKSGIAIHRAHVGAGFIGPVNMFGHDSYSPRRLRSFR